MIRKTLLAVVVCAAVAGLSGGSAMAGEVTGSGKNPEHNQGKSWCSFLETTTTRALLSTALDPTVVVVNPSHSGRTTSWVSRIRMSPIPARSAT